METNKDFTREFKQELSIMLKNINAYGEENDKRTLARQAVQNLLYALAKEVQNELNEENKEEQQMWTALEDVIEDYESDGDRDILFNYLYEKQIDLWHEEDTFEIVEVDEDKVISTYYRNEILNDTSYGVVREVKGETKYFYCIDTRQDGAIEKEVSIEVLAQKLNINLKELKAELNK